MISKIIENITQFLSSIESVKRVQGGASLSEAIAETPTIQVYFDKFLQSDNSSVDRISFGKGSNVIRTPKCTVIIDIYARQRSHIGKDLEVCYNILDDVIEKLKLQVSSPYFNTEGITGYKYEAERAVFQYGNTMYTGVRITLDLFLIGR